MSVYAATSGAPAPPSGNLGVRHVLQMRSRAVSAAHRSLRQDKVLVLGEVLTARPHGRLIYVLLRDAENDDNVLQALLPSSVKVPPVGEMVAICGRLVVSRAMGEDGAMQIQVEGDSLECRGTSKRISARRALMKRLKSERTCIAQLDRTVEKVTLIAPKESQGAEDFCRILNSDRTHPVQIRHIPTAFHDPAKVTEAVREASSYDEPVVITRGGGSAVAMDVLSASDVILAVYQCSMRRPVILAVGHSSDSMLSSHFVTKACHTPSYAATYLRQCNARFRDQARDAEAERRARAHSAEQERKAQVAREEQARRWSAEQAKNRTWSVRTRRWCEARIPLVKRLAFWALIASVFAGGWILRGVVQGDPKADYSSRFLNEFPTPAGLTAFGVRVVETVLGSVKMFVAWICELIQAVLLISFLFFMAVGVIKNAGKRPRYRRRW